VATGLHCLDQGARRDLPGDAPAVPAPAALAFLAAVADDRVPVPVRFLLIVSRDLEAEALALGKLGAAVQAEAGDAADGELDGEHVAFLAAGKVGGRLADGGDLAVGEGPCVELCGLFGVLVEPQADRVLRCHELILSGPSAARWRLCLSRS